MSEPRKRSVTSIRIRGLAERADSPEQPLGPEVIVPEGPVALRVQFDTRSDPVGIVTLHRDEQGIHAEGEIFLGGDGPHAEAMRKDHPAALWPKLALGIAKPLVESDAAHPAGIVTSGRIVSVSLVRENTDPGLPPWEVVTDPPGQCGKCGTTLEYRDRFLPPAP